MSATLFAVGALLAVPRGGALWRGFQGVANSTDIYPSATAPADGGGVSAQVTVGNPALLISVSRQSPTWTRSGSLAGADTNGGCIPLGFHFFYFDLAEVSNVTISESRLQDSMIVLFSYIDRTIEAPLVPLEGFSKRIPTLTLLPGRYYVVLSRTSTATSDYTLEVATTYKPANTVQPGTRASLYSRASGLPVMGTGTCRQTYSASYPRTLVYAGRGFCDARPTTAFAGTCSAYCTTFNLACDYAYYESQTGCADDARTCDTSVDGSVVCACIARPQFGSELDCTRYPSLASSTAGSDNVVLNAGGDRFYKLLVPSDVRYVKANTSCTSAIDTVLRLWDGNFNTVLAVGDDSSSCGRGSTIIAQLSEGTYYLHVEGYADSEGAFQLSARCPTRTSSAIKPDPDLSKNITKDINAKIISRKKTSRSGGIIAAIVVPVCLAALSFGAFISRLAARRTCCRSKATVQPEN